MRQTDVGLTEVLARLGPRRLKQIALILAALLVALVVVAIVLLSDSRTPSDLPGDVLVVAPASGANPAPIASGSSHPGMSGTASPTVAPATLATTAPPVPTAGAAAAGTASPAKAPPSQPSAGSTGGAPTTFRPFPRDAAAIAIAIASLPYTRALNTAGLATELAGPECGAGPTVWFSYRADVSMRLAATTLGSAYDTVLYVARRNSDDRIDWDDCSDDAGSGQHSAVVFEAVAGATYLFRVASFDGAAGGALVFNLSAAPSPIVLWVSPNPEGTFDRDGNATVSGTVTCSGGTGDVYIDLVLRQRVERVVVEGHAYAEVADCSSRPARWASRIEGNAGTFGDEPATLSAHGWVCGDLECVSGEANADVTLRFDGPSPRPTASPIPTASPSPSPTPASTTAPSPSPSPSPVASVDPVALDATQSPPAP